MKIAKLLQCLDINLRSYSDLWAVELSSYSDMLAQIFKNTTNDEFRSETLKNFQI